MERKISKNTTKMCKRGSFSRILDEAGLLAPANGTATNLEEAKKVYPDLDPDVNGQNFTWAMHDKVDGQPAMRFESWAAEAIFGR
jgi:hypothetical protein